MIIDKELMRTPLVIGKPFPHRDLLKRINKRLDKQFGYLKGQKFVGFSFNKIKTSDNDIYIQPYQSSSVSYYVQTGREYVIAKLGPNCTESNRVVKSASNCIRNVCNSNLRLVTTFILF